MAKIGIIVADGARARFITAEIIQDPGFEGSPRMVEHDNVVHPLGDLPAREEFSDRMTRRVAGPGRFAAGPVMDDHRDRHELEDDRRFARSVIDSAEHFVSEQRPTRLVLTAAPRLLGVLRSQIDPKRWNGLDVVELSLDVSGKSLHEIREVLTLQGLLPEPELPRAGVFRPRGQAVSTR